MFPGNRGPQKTTWKSNQLENHIRSKGLLFDKFGKGAPTFLQDWLVGLPQAKFWLFGKIWKFHFIKSKGAPFNPPFEGQTRSAGGFYEGSTSPFLSAKEEKPKKLPSLVVTHLKDHHIKQSHSWILFIQHQPTSLVISFAPRPESLGIDLLCGGWDRGDQLHMKHAKPRSCGWIPKPWAVFFPKTWREIAAHLTLKRIQSRDFEKTTTTKTALLAVYQNDYFQRLNIFEWSLNPSDCLEDEVTPNNKWWGMWGVAKVGNHQTCSCAKRLWVPRCPQASFQFEPFWN